jgi:hypothetical protein
MPLCKSGGQPETPTEHKFQTVENIGFEPICVLIANQMVTPSNPIPQMVPLAVIATAKSDQAD